jgi:hypothetical protein
MDYELNCFDGKVGVSTHAGARYEIPGLWLLCAAARGLTQQQAIAEWRATHKPAERCS